MDTRKPYPSDVSEEEWAFVAPYLALVREDAPQREHDLREVFNGLRWVVRTGSPWRYMPHDLPPWEAVYQQTQRWLKAGVFEEMVHDLRVLLRLLEGRAPEPTAAILDSRTLRSTPQSGSRGGYEGAKRKKGSKVHAAVDTLGNLLALHVSPANEQDSGRVEELAEAIQEATGESVELAYVDQGYTGEKAAEEAEAHGMRLEIVRHEEAKRGFVLLPRRLCRGAGFRMGIALSTLGEGLREAAYHFGGVALCRLRLPLSPAGDRHSHHGFITRSRLRALVAEHGEESSLEETLLEELYSFVGEGWEQEDDITLLSLRRS
jgi:transposase